jgi:flavin-dependent dehydrogenase
VIEAVPGGWFYLAALPGNELIVAFITLATLVPGARHGCLPWWLKALARTELVRSILNGCPLPETLSVTNARGSYARIAAGERWLAIGDARIAPDPLSGQGIIWAIDDATSAVELISRMERRDFAEEVRARTVREIDAYLLERSRAYSSERRFKDDPFWSSASGWSGS